MQRRKFLKTAGLAAAASTTLAAPAIAQSGELHWRMTTSWPKSLDTLFGGAEYMCKRIGEMTGGKFQIRCFAGGEIVPALNVVDAVQNGTVEMGHTASYYYVGKDPCFAFDCALPFGLNARQQQAWILWGGGQKLVDEFYAGYNIKSIIAGNTGNQMGGWFRKEVKSLEDLKGLKFRIGGVMSGQVCTRLGIVPQQIAGGDIYPALEKGTIDAAEWVGPYDDEKLGFYKIAKYYYYPGWWEVGPQLSAYINIDKWNALPAEYKAIVQAAGAEASMWMTAKYDAENPVALKRLLAGGAQLRPFPRDTLAAALKASDEIYDDFTTKNPMFKKMYASWHPFRAEQVSWFRVAENTSATFMGSPDQLKLLEKKLS